MVEEVPGTPLLPPGQSNEEVHAAISQQSRAHRYIEIEKGNIHQSLENIWASVAHQLKAVAEKRGWANDPHILLLDIVWQISYETGDRRVSNLFRIVGSTHQDFYGNTLEWSEILNQSQGGMCICREL